MDSAAAAAAPGGAAFPRFSWARSDIERRLGFPAARFTGAGLPFTFSVALLLSILFYAGLYPIQDRYFGQIFYNRGVTPYPTVLFSFWSIAILLTKRAKLREQRKALDLRLLPETPAFVLSQHSAQEVLDRIQAAAEDPDRYLLLARVSRCVKGLRNIGRVSDAADLLRSQAENDENHVDGTFTLVQGFIWGIPVLGFIGTVLGLSQAIGSFGGAFAGQSDLAQLKDALTQVTAGLSVAFDTTLIALVAAFVIQLLLIAQKKREFDFLDDCWDYCHSHLVSRIRIVSPDEAAAGEAGA